MTYKTRFQYLLDKARDIAQAEALLNPLAHDLPPLFFFTDPSRTPHPEDIAAQLPEGCGMVYRHFGDAHAAQRARLLRKISTDRGLVFMIGQDWRLALEIDADGVHMPERDLSQILELHTQNPTLRFSLACHNLATLRKAEALDGALSAVFVSPVFVSASASARGVEPLGVKGLRAFTEASPLPVYALGGINCDTIGKLRDAGLSGVAAIDAFRLED